MIMWPSVPKIGTQNAFHNFMLSPNFNFLGLAVSSLRANQFSSAKSLEQKLKRYNALTQSPNYVLIQNPNWAKPQRSFKYTV